LLAKAKLDGDLAHNFDFERKNFNTIGIRRQARVVAANLLIAWQMLLYNLDTYWPLGNCLWFMLIMMLQTWKH